MISSLSQQLRRRVREAGPQRVINLANALLVTLVLGLSAHAAWKAIVDYRAAHAIQATTVLSDAIVHTTAATAVERGITSAALGGGAERDADLPAALMDIRAEAEAHWQETRTLARQLVDGSGGYRQAWSEVEQAYVGLIEVRAAVDRFLDGGASRVEIPVWVARVADFNRALEKLRKTAFEIPHSHAALSTLNLTLRHWIWLVSEYAGLERGTLAYYISRREPIPDHVIHLLHAYRGVVDHNLAEIHTLVRQPGADPRLRTTEEAMRTIFIGHFGAIRAAVFAAARDGAYPLSGAAWVGQSTAAIGSVLALADASAEVSADMAEELARRSFRRLVAHAALVLGALLLAAFSATKVRHTANQLFHEKELAEVTLHSIGDAVITTDAQGQVEYLNPVAERYTGWTTAEAAGRPLRELLNLVHGFTREPEEDPVSECLRLGRIVALKDNTVMRRRDGTEIAIGDSAAPIRDSEGQIVGAVMVFYDLSSDGDTRHLLAHYATRDALTGLANRREFDRRLNELLTRAKRRGEEHALCYIDLDQFKVINDTCGHMVGDKLLCQLSYLLQRHIRDSDTLARLGGDEFGLLLVNCPLPRAEKVAETLRNVIRQFRFTWEGRTFDLACSIGLVPITIESVSPAEVLSEADAACYAAKEKGRNRVQLFQPGDGELARRHGEMQWVSRLQAALREDRLVLFVQDIVPIPLKGQLPPHREILLRLRDEDGNLVPPMSFIPAAERYNVMPEIDRWVIRHVCEWIRDSAEDGGIVYNINLSGASLSDHHGLRDYILECCEAYAVAPERVCFEITETAAVRNLIEATDLMEALKQVGFRFALDDFGSGLSSFMYLKTLPVDFLKIDGNFVRDMVANPVDQAMVEAINRIGHVMNIRTVAEFVEDDAVLNRLRQLGVDYGQGYGLGRPQPLRTAFTGHAGEPEGCLLKL